MKNNLKIKKRDGFRQRFYYTLTFSYTFKYDDDTVYFAHSFPYTYTNLMEYLNKTMLDKEN
jgi:hypothetical protein